MENHSENKIVRVAHALIWHVITNPWLFVKEKVRQHKELNKKYPVVRGIKGEGSIIGHALVDFVVEPYMPDYDGEGDKRHSHWTHVVNIVNLLKEMGYEVDVTDWRNRKAPSATGYDLVVGIHDAFTSSCTRKPGKCKKIYLGTGAYTAQAIAEEEKRLESLFNRKGVKLKRRGRVSNDIGPHLADVIFVMGSEWVIDTYRKIVDIPIYSYPNTTVDGVATTFEKKNFDKARENFMWLSAFGAVFRGLDILLEVFAEMPDCHLWICGGIEHESDFMDLYKKELRETPNIHLVGWIDVTSDEFSELTSKCAYLIYPSASDGMPGSVVNCMAAGLIPLVTLEAGVDTGGYGKLISEYSHEILRFTVLDASRENPDCLKQEAESVSNFARSFYNEDRFIKAWRKNLHAALDLNI